MQNSRFKTQMQSSPHSRLKNLRLRLWSQWARISSSNVNGAFAEQGRMNPKKKISERDQEAECLHGRGWQNFRETEPYHDKSQFLPEEEFSKSWTSFVKARPWKHLKQCFLILKSLNSDNLRRRLKESMEALGSFLFFRTHALEGKVDNQDGKLQSACTWRTTVKMTDC